MASAMLATCGAVMISSWKGDSGDAGEGAVSASAAVERRGPAMTSADEGIEHKGGQLDAGCPFYTLATRGEGQASGPSVRSRMVGQIGTDRRQTTRRSGEMLPVGNRDLGAALWPTSARTSSRHNTTPLGALYRHDYSVAGSGLGSRPPADAKRRQCRGSAWEAALCAQALAS